MRLTSSESKLGFVASFLGIAQGVAWFIMSLICIILYNDGITIEVPESYIRVYNLMLYGQFLYKDGSALSTSYIISPEIFQVFMWIYLFLNIAWITISILLIYAISNNKTTVVNAMKVWAILVFIICLLDGLFELLVGIDFEICLVDGLTISEEMLCYNIYLPVMTIIARGYTLWIVNIVFVYLLWTSSRQIQGKVNPVYGGSIPRPTLQRSASMNPGNNNPPQNNLYSPTQTGQYPQQNYYVGSNDNRYPPLSPTYQTPSNSNQNRWPGQWANDSRSQQSPTYPAQGVPSQPNKYVY